MFVVLVMPVASARLDSTCSYRTSHPSKFHACFSLILPCSLIQTAPDELDPAIDDLTAQEIASLEQWEQFFADKYEVVGTYA